MFWKSRKRDELVYRENLELGHRLKAAELKNKELEEMWSRTWSSCVASQAEQIAVWKERGDKYANHNVELQKNILEINTALVGILTRPDLLGAYKDVLERITQPKKETK